MIEAEALLNWLGHIERVARCLFLATKAEDAGEWIADISTGADLVVAEVMSLIEHIERRQNG